jgi:hypothetical protein
LIPKTTSRPVLAESSYRLCAIGQSLGGPNLPQDILGRLDFTFYSNPVDASLKAPGL